jgi:hypothetical protein
MGYEDDMMVNFPFSLLQVPLQQQKCRRPTLHSKFLMQQFRRTVVLGSARTSSWLDCGLMRELCALLMVLMKCILGLWRGWNLGSQEMLQNQTFES